MNDTSIKFGSTSVILGPAPIRPSWILEGQPVARYNLLFASADGTATTIIWDCTAGRFNWFYDIDETLCILEGSVTLKDGAGVSRIVGAGDIIFFPAGSHAEWTVETYVRKIAFCRTVMPGVIVSALRFRRWLLRLLGIAGGKTGTTAMFGGT